MENVYMAIPQVPIQEWTQVYDLPTALAEGTIFPELNKPFYVAPENSNTTLPSCPPLRQVFLSMPVSSSRTIPYYNSLILNKKWVTMGYKKWGGHMDINKRIIELENEIASLPQGSINIKKINGKEQPYLQWTENGKSKYIRMDEREQIFAGVERRKQLQEKLRELKNGYC